MSVDRRSIPAATKTNRTPTTTTISSNRAQQPSPSTPQFSRATRVGLQTNTTYYYQQSQTPKQSNTRYRSTRPPYPARTVYTTGVSYTMTPIPAQYYPSVTGVPPRAAAVPSHPIMPLKRRQQSNATPNRSMKQAHTSFAKQQLSSWSGWSPCSVTCGTGTQVRFKTLSNQKHIWQSQACSFKECAPYWTGWSEWSQCTASCGYSRRYRQRMCIGTVCKGASLRFEICSVPLCRRVQKVAIANPSNAIRRGTSSALRAKNRSKCELHCNVKIFTSFVEPKNMVRMQLRNWVDVLQQL
ncbi:unnamed protein product [Anisakis simplex]|uniref:Hemicentin-1 n=1 Tax=Anisakis simplex TaxID=6269 RepID=A0A0M3K3R3_ANISI|nr:unnamed protein product [Anisakis simplex]